MISEHLCDVLLALMGIIINVTGSKVQHHMQA